MTDAATRARPEVTRSVEAGPYIILRLDQLDAAKAALDSHGLMYWVDKFALRIGENPPLTVINFGRKGDADRIEAAIDAAF